MSTKPARGHGHRGRKNASAQPATDDARPTGGFAGVTAWLLGRPWWQGAGVVLALLLAGIPVVLDHGNTPAQAPLTQSNSGDCNVMGTGNVVTCVASKPRSFGQIHASINGVDKQYRLGTAGQPLRWLLQDEETIPATVDWHPVTHRWQTGVDNLIGGSD